MKEFVLPSLQSSYKRPLWTSQVTLPHLPAEVTVDGSAAALPLIDRSCRSLELRRLRAKTAALEAESQIEQLKSLERKIRSVICGREHEKRHQLIWQYQKEKAKIERETAVIEAKALALQRSKYMRGVLQHQERGYLLHVETATRVRLMTEEEDDRRHVTSLCRLDFLAIERRQALRDVESAEYVAEEFKTISDWEGRIATMSFRPTEAFLPVTQIVPCRNVGSAVYHGRENLLMDYSVCEEEWGKRLELLANERTACLLLEWQHSVAKLMFVAEPCARTSLEEMCCYGSCQVRLTALLLIQRWWRMLRAASWKERRQRELKMILKERRRQMTSRDYHSVLRRLKRKLQSSTTPVSLEKLCNAMTALVRAAELSYQYLFDYFVYTLMNRAANLQGIEAHRLRNYPLVKDDGTSSTPQVSALLCVPYRLFVRQQTLQPYQFWRALRWVEGSTSFMRRVHLLEEAETQARVNVLLPQEEQCRDRLRIYFVALKGGSWTWRSLYVAICCIEEEEAICRSLVQTDEQTSRDLLLVDVGAALLRCVASEEKFSQLISDEEQERLAIVEAECDKYNSLTEGEWRWKNLLKLRKKLRDSCGGKIRWRMASNINTELKFFSLDSTARVIQRFFHVLHRRICRERQVAARTKAMFGEKRLKAIAVELLDLLAAQHSEMRKTEIVSTATTLVGNRFLRERAGVSVENQVQLFCAWFDEKASEPMQREYKAIVARFLCSHKEFYKRMHKLFAAMRHGREAIERQAENEYISLQCTTPYIAIVLCLLPAQEAAQRKRLEADAAAELSALSERSDMLVALARCTASASEHEWRSCGEELSLMNPIERLLSREEITRVRIVLEERRDTCAILLFFYATIRESLIKEEQQERTTLYKHINDSLYAISPFFFLLREEKLARHDVECAALVGYSDVLQRAHVMLAQCVFYPRFLRERLALWSEARYFDTHLTELLLRRVAFVGTKLEELVAAESCARQRVEYMEEIDRCLRFVSE